MHRSDTLHRIGGEPGLYPRIVVLGPIHVPRRHVRRAAVRCGVGALRHHEAMSDSDMRARSVASCTCGPNVLGALACVVSVTWCARLGTRMVWTRR